MCFSPIYIRNGTINNVIQKDNNRLEFCKVYKKTFSFFNSYEYILSLERMLTINLSKKMFYSNWLCFFFLHKYLN